MTSPYITPSFDRDEYRAWLRAKSEKPSGLTFTDLSAMDAPVRRAVIANSPALSGKQKENWSAQNGN